MRCYSFQVCDMDEDQFFGVLSNEEKEHLEKHSILSSEGFSWIWHCIMEICGQSKTEPCSGCHSIAKKVGLV